MRGVPYEPGIAAANSGRYELARCSRTGRKLREPRLAARVPGHRRDGNPQAALVRVDVRAAEMGAGGRYGLAGDRRFYSRPDFSKIATQSRRAFGSGARADPDGGSGRTPGALPDDPDRTG